MKKIVIIGATSSIAEHCARVWSREVGVHFILVARNIQRLESIAADLKVRNPKVKVDCCSVDFTDATAIQNLADDITKEGSVNVLLVAHGTLPDQNEAIKKIWMIRESIEINAISPVLFAEAFAGHMISANTGSIALIGSVAGDRGRKSNYVYGSAKGLVELYTQGLRHRFTGTDVDAIIIKPGPTNTPMTAHLNVEGQSLANVESVAEVVVRGIENKQSSIYAPRKWTLIMFIIRNLPNWLFNKLNI